MTNYRTTPPFSGPDEPVDVAVVVVTYNNEADIDRLIASLRTQAQDQSLRVIIVDNGSVDQTVARALRHDDVMVVLTGGNLGYAGGINTAMQFTTGAADILVLNPDARVEDGSLAELRQSLRDRNAAVVAPRIVGADNETYDSLRREPSLSRALGDAVFGRIWTSRPSWLGEIVRRGDEYAHAHPIHWASGAALLMSSEVAREIGEWDEQFFLYSEETDYQRRVRDAGYTIWYEPAAIVHHTERGSGFTLPLDRLIAVNRVRYARKHMGRVSADAYRCAVALHHLLRSSVASYRTIFRTVIKESSWGTLPRARRDGPPQVAHLAPTPQAGRQNPITPAGARGNAR